MRVMRSFYIITHTQQASAMISRIRRLDWSKSLHSHRYFCAESEIYFRHTLINTQLLGVYARSQRLFAFVFQQIYLHLCMRDQLPPKISKQYRMLRIQIEENYMDRPQRC